MAIEVLQSQELDRNRANLYKILSVLYHYPTLETGEMIQQLKETLRNLDSQDIGLAEEMEEEFTFFKNDLTSLKVDHAKLFIGPFDILALPYSSVYLDNGRKIMGESSLEAVKFYQQAGLEINTDFKEAPDHIRAELEFMYYLIAKSLNGGEDNLFREQQKLFLLHHLGLWIKSFSDLVIERANTPFYRNLGKMTKNMMEKELQYVKTL